MKKRYFFIIFILGLASFFVWQSVYLPKSRGVEEVLFSVEKGQNVSQIAKNLEKENLINSSLCFKTYVFLTGKYKKLQAGTYLLSPSMNIPEIAKKFVSGDIAKIKITIPEGFTSEEIYQKFKNVTGSDLVTLKEYEGYLFPDTYEIRYGATEEEIIKMMLDNFEKKTADLEITPEIVITASLLEKEVKTDEEKRLAADVLWKRLEIGMPLQVDACMWTYENLGLPQKPICNPGLESIQAAVYPESSEYWYYLSKPDGETLFFKTLEEHNIAKAKYLK